MLNNIPFEYQFEEGIAEKLRLYFLVRPRLYNDNNIIKTKYINSYKFGWPLPLQANIIK